MLFFARWGDIIPKWTAKTSNNCSIYRIESGKRNHIWGQKIISKKFLKITKKSVDKVGGMWYITQAVSERGRRCTLKIEQ